MPSANTQSENKKYSLKRRELTPTREQQYCQPQRQHRADAVADQLEDFEWGHESVGRTRRQKQEAGGSRQDAGTTASCLLLLPSASCRLPTASPPCCA